MFLPVTPDKSESIITMKDRIPSDCYEDEFNFKSEMETKLKKRNEREEQKDEEVRKEEESRDTRAPKGNKKSLIT